MTAPKPVAALAANTDMVTTQHGSTAVSRHVGRAAGHSLPLGQLRRDLLGVGCDVVRPRRVPSMDAVAAPVLVLKAVPFPHEAAPDDAAALNRG